MSGRWFRWFGVGAAVAVAAAAQGAPRPRGHGSQAAVNLPAVRHVAFANGLSIVLMEHHRAPVLEIVATVDGGSSRDPAGKAGTASLTAELLRRGTETRDANALAEQIDFLGGSLDGTADHDAVRIHVSGLAKDTDAWLDLLADVLRMPAFPADELDRARRLRLDALASLVEDPAALADRAATRLVYAGTPYGAVETPETLSAITRDDLVAYHRARLTPSHVTIVAVGDFTASAMAEKLRARFADWPRADATSGGARHAVPLLADGIASRPPISRRVAPVAAGRRIILVDKPDAEQAHLRFVRTGLTRTSPRLTATRVAAAVLGGGFTSRLVEEARIRRSLTYGIWCLVRPLRVTGEVEIATFTKVATTRRIADVVTAVAAKTARDGVTPAELQKVQGYLAGLFAIEAQTPAALASRLADAAVYHLPDTDLTGYIGRVRGVTLADANRTARDMLDPRTMSLVVVGPAAKVSGQLRGLGKVETVRAEDEVR